LSQGIVFNIQRFSIYDGPGARTSVFFKGCNLHCRWCHNPESIPAHPVLEYYAERCISCGRCFAACPVHAHTFDENGKHIVDRNLCTNCLRCVDTCFAEALIGVGQAMTADELVDAVMTDMPYYERSGGGVTFTGGECMLQHEFLLEVLKKLKARGVNNAVDTAGNVPWEWFEDILPFTDLFLYDIKAADSQVH
jgi:pyruvate formate lyase activating enzyme